MKITVNTNEMKAFKEFGNNICEIADVVNNSSTTQEQKDALQQEAKRFALVRADTFGNTTIEVDENITIAALKFAVVVAKMYQGAIRVAMTYKNQVIESAIAFKDAVSSVVNK